MRVFQGLMMRLFPKIAKEWHPSKNGDSRPEEFAGELLSDHPSIDFTLKDRNVSGPIQYFNFPDDWTSS